MEKSKRQGLLVIGILLIQLMLPGCEQKAEQSVPAPEVFYVVAANQPYQPQRIFNARIDSKSDVAITAEVTGKLIAIHFKEGDQVVAGAPLFDIDPAPFEAELAKAKAEQSKAQAAAASADKNFARAKTLVKDGYISGSEYDTLEAKKLEADAAVEATKAALGSANVNLKYTKITAPQAGKVGRAVPALGDVVSPGYGPLTTLVGQEGMEVVFQVPEKVVLAAESGASEVSQTDIDVNLLMPDGSEYPYKGTIDYISNRVDPATGTVEVRARIPNPDGLLRPGLYVQAMVRLIQPLQGLMIPQAAVQVDQLGSYVLSIDSSDQVVRNNIQTGPRYSENVLVESGLEAGARVIIRGIQKARPGSAVIATAMESTTQNENAGSVSQ